MNKFKNILEVFFISFFSVIFAMSISIGLWIDFTVIKTAIIYSFFATIIRNYFSKKSTHTDGIL